MELSPQIEDYLKGIYMLQTRDRQVSTTALAGRLGITAPSVTAMVHKLVELELLVHEPYRGVSLTPKGETLALRIVRAHRLWEAYLVESLGLPWDEAHIEAERLEHVLSDLLAERIDEALGFPTIDPHGHPIPSPTGHVQPVTGVALAELTVGDVGVVVQIRDETPELLRYLGEFGVYPGEVILVLDVAPFNGPMHLRVAGKTQVLGREVANHVVVQPEVAIEGGT